MKDIDEIRRDNLRLVEAQFGGPTGAANALGMSVAQFSNLRDGAKDSKTGKPRGMRKETARRIENGAGREPGWLDVEHTASGGVVHGGAATTQLARSSEDAKPTVTGTLADLGELLIQASPKTRAAVADLLGRYAQDPATGQSLAQAIEVLIKAEQTSKTK